MDLRKPKAQLGINFTRTLFSLIISKDKKTRRRTVYKIKDNLDFPNLCLASDYLDKNVRLDYKEYIFGNPLPNSYQTLGKCEFSPITKDLIKEINWTLLSFRKYSNEISNFLVLKDQFENYFLRGNYYEAEKVISKIESTICYSLWTLEARFLINEFSTGTAENKELLSKFNSENHSEFYTKSLAHYLSLRAEKSLSVNRFSADLENALIRIEGGNKGAHTEYYLFKLSFLNHLKFTHFKELISYDFQHSIIDRYLNFRKVLVSILTTVNQLLEKEGGDLESVKQFLINRINYLIKKINDPILYKLKLFAGDSLFPAFDEVESKEQIEILDLFTVGEYYEVEKRLRNLFDKKNLQFDLYELYAKSLVYQRKQFIPAGNPKSLQNQILLEIYNVISVGPSYNEAGVNLLRMANNLSNSVLSYGILNFVLHYTRGKSERKLISRLSYSASNPIIHEVFSDAEVKLNYLELLKKRLPHSLTIDLTLKQLKDPSALVEYETKLPDLTFKIALAEMHQNATNFQAASKIWEYVLANYIDTIPAFEIALINLFKCYEALERYDDCITLFVDSFYINPLIISKVEVQSILKKISKNRFKNVTANIDLPIFYTICNADENETHTTFEKYNLSLGVCKPSEIISKVDIHEKDKTFFYLKFTCGPEILKHSIHINGSKERLEERLKIVQFLRDKDTLDKNFYDDEIKYISNILVIQKGLMELDESKIYVNEQGIIANELKEYDAIYQRFKAIARIAEKSHLWMLDKRGRLTTVNYSEDVAETNTPEYSSNPVYDIYKELFDAIKEKFLYSKFGIVAYLSTRIRHGVLLGEIRPIFEKHKLITLREADSANYRRNYHWDMIYSSISENQLTKIQNHLKEFSYSVDGLIFDLIKKYLQVYDEVKNKDGWFNYDFSDDELFWFSIRSLKTTNFTQFAQEVFEILWDRTDNNLNTIREKIQNETSQEFNKLFDQLELDISTDLSTHSNQAIIGAIKACSTETHITISRISRWFKRSGTTASDFKLSDLIDIVMEYTNKSHNNKVVDLERDVQFNDKLKGEYLTHFADLFRIFTENILKHADDQATVISAKITALLTSPSDLIISIENEITNKESLDALKNVWRDETINIGKLVSEGKSGYHKAFKILRSDLKCDTNYLKTELSENEETFAITMFIDLKELLA